MLIKKREIRKLSADIRKMIAGTAVDLRDNREGVWSILKNDIHTLSNIKNEQANSFQRERDNLADTLANISHQLKTPLTSMLIMADLLENAPPEKCAEFIRTIKAELTHMDWLVSALLKMARLDAGAIEFAAGKIRVSTLVDLALEPLRILLDIKAQQVEVMCDTELLCDKRWTVEALTNLLKNASESSPIDGIIRIDSGSNPICQWISVTDSGNGISYKKMTTLFKRFTGSRSDKGYGIGLPLALAIMQGQNGDISVENNGYGNGATFTMKFYI